MNVVRTRKAIQKLGLTARRRGGEWRINYRNGQEETAYYTNDSADALGTAREMARFRPGLPSRRIITEYGIHGMFDQADMHTIARLIVANTITPVETTTVIDRMHSRTAILLSGGFND